MRLLNHAALVWSLLTMLVLSALFHWRGFDDPYITFRYAENIASGHGFVYNAGERVLSTTAPLYALLLALAALAGLDVPTTANVLGCVALGAGGFALWKLGQVWQTPLAGAAGLLLYPTFPLLTLTLGAEIPLVIAFILFGLLAYAHQRLFWTAVLLALATLVRADSVLAVAVVGGAVLLARQQPFPWRAVVLGAALLLPWFAFAWGYFGAPLPVTMAAKRVQGLMPASTPFFEGLLQLWFWQQSLYALYLVLALAGMGYALLRRRGWLLLLAWSLLYLVAYSVLRVPDYPWYYGPLVPGLVVLVGLGVAALGWQARRLVRHAPWSSRVGVAVLLLLFLAQAADLAVYRAVPDPRLALYREVGEWLAANTAPDASVGALEVGILGYYAQRRMIDFAGLIQPETTERLAHSQTFADTVVWATSHFQPDYLVLQESLVPLLDEEGLLAPCEVVQTFEDDIYAERLQVYACGWEGQ
jgi:hypothetical protein